MDFEGSPQHLSRQLPGLLARQRLGGLVVVVVDAFWQVETRPAGVEDKPWGRPPLGGLEDVRLAGVLAQFQT